MINPSAERSGSYVLDPGTIGRYLADRHLIDWDSGDARALAGGVSNDVVMVSNGASTLVVKQSLPRLRVAEEWLANQGRIVTEGEALRLAGSICFDAAPPVVDVFPDDHLLVMEGAPPGHSVWKEDLLAGRIAVEVARRVGYLIGSWHAATFQNTATQQRFGDLEAFIQLRIDPYYHTISRRHSDLAVHIDWLASTLLRRRRCLVHGDLSPKNILVHGDRIWVIDWEVAHFGDPVFDLAFILCHLRCKAFHRPGDIEEYRSCAVGFLDAYRAVGETVLNEIDEDYLVAQTACLMLARVDGKSLVEYLNDDARGACRSLARRLLAGSGRRLDALWSD